MPRTAALKPEQAPTDSKPTLDHPIFTRWPAQYPDRLQLFSLPTPNGVKVGIMLEETSLAYEPHRIDIMADENHDPAFLGRSEHPLRNDPVGDVADGWSRADVRPGRLLQ